MSKKRTPQEAPPMAAVQREALSVGAVAQALGVGKVTVYRLLREGQLRRVKIGHRTVVPAGDVAALVERLANLPKGV